KEHRINDAIAGIQNKQFAAFIDQPDSMGMTPLQIAAYEGMTEVVLALAASGAKINKRKGRINDLSFKTTFYLGLFRGHKLTAQILLFLGADLTLARNIAIKEDNDELLNYLVDLAIDPDVFCGVASWSIAHHTSYDDDVIIDLLMKQIKPNQP